MLSFSINLYSQIIVIEDDVIIDWTTYDEEAYNQFGFFSFIDPNITLNNFDAFEVALGKYNTDFMNRSVGVLVLGMGGTYKKWLTELSCGFLYSYDIKNDSLTIKFNKTQYGIGFGYNLINAKRVVITPKTSIYWNRYKLLNSSKEKVNLEKYVSERDLDIRLNQLTGFLGLNVSYKIYYPIVFPVCDYFTVELYGGYIFQFNEKPWVYSPNKRLINDNKIDLKNYSFGLRFSFYIE